MIHKVGFVVHLPKSDPDRNLTRLIKRKPKLKWLLRLIGAKRVERFVWPNIPISMLKAGQSTLVTSPGSNRQVQMYCWGVPYTPKMMMHRTDAVKKTVQAARMLIERHGVNRIGLGQFTSNIGRRGKGIDVAEQIHQLEFDAHVTTGNSLTTATAYDAGIGAAIDVGFDPSEMTVAVVGAGGHIGFPLAKLFSESVRKVLLVGRRGSDLSEVSRQIGAQKSHQTGLDEATKQADLIVTVTSAMDELDFQPGLLKKGAIVVDPSRPRNVGPLVEEKRPDVLVIEGSLIKLPGEASLNIDQGLPAGIVFACEAETMILEISGVESDFSIGELDLSCIRWINQQRNKYGFSLAGYRSGDKPIEVERIERHRQFVKEARR